MRILCERHLGEYMTTQKPPLYIEELITNTHNRQYWIYKNDSFYQQRIASAGPYQKKNLIHLRQLRPQARTIIDVGANIGMNTIEYATWANTVHAFEPTSQTYSMLKRNVDLALNPPLEPKGWYETDQKKIASAQVTGQIQTYCIALSSTQGKSEIIIKKDNAGHNYLDNLHLPTRTGQVRARPTQPPTESVKLRTLDSYQFNLVDAIKIDVEGHEFDVVKGAEQTIIKHRPVVQLEMVEHQPIRFNWNCQQIYDWFYERDYIPTLSTGKSAGRLWHKFPREMERFFIHKDEYQQSTFETLFEHDDPTNETKDRPYWNYDPPARKVKDSPTKTKLIDCIDRI